MSALQTPLIPRSILFGNPERIMVRLSPDGQYISYITPRDGVLNIYVAPRAKPLEGQFVTADKGRGIRSYFWAYNNQDILYVQDSEGNEDWHVYRVNIKASKVQDLTPLKNVQARIVELSEKFPDEVLISLNDRDPAYHDIYRLNLKTGERHLLYKNEDYAGLVTDEDFNIRFGIRQRADGGYYFMRWHDGKFVPWSEVDPDDALTCRPLAFDKSGQVLYMIDSRGRDTAAFTAIDLSRDHQQVLYENPRADVSDILVHPTEKTIQAIASAYLRKDWTILDESIGQDLEYLKTLEAADVEIASRSLDDHYWIVAFLVDDGPVKYYLYDRNEKQATHLFASNSALENQPLVKMQTAVVRSRDGLDLTCYYSLPRDSKGPGPLVLYVHGGPWARDSWGFDGIHQWLTNRGYGVLSVNFRGSTGLGKSFTNAGNGQWGAKMHDDLLDAVQWAIDQGIADPNQVAIMGGSYGGYAVLHALTGTPDVFACGVDIVGPSNLVTLMETIPAYWKPIFENFKRRVGGDPETDAGRTFLKERSPLTHVDNIKKPLLIGQGANDPRVKQAESDQIVKAMQDKRIAHTYVLFPDEWHGFARPENRLAFYALAEAFLAQNLNGRCEPLGNDLEGSSYQIVTDSYGLVEAAA